jgi:aldose sugar dehydrogenase
LSGNFCFFEQKLPDFMKTIKILLFLGYLFSQNFALAQVKLQTKNIITNLDTPWDLVYGPDNWIWVTERVGKVSRVNPATGELKVLLTIPDAKEQGEGGLLGMALDPDFSQNGYLYVAYNYFAPGNDYREKIVRYTYDSAKQTLTSPQIILDNIDGANTHNGCRMVISKDKKLFLTTGDAQVTSSSQTPATLNGKILRINLDGSIPTDNPIKNSPVWSWGHRNAQGLSFSPNGDILYSSEHGANSDDELNIIKRGRNYGWPKIEGLCDTQVETNFCKDSNVVEPIQAWTPTLGVAGTAFYNSDVIADWKNSILMVSLKGGRLTQLKLDDKGEKVTAKTDYFTNTYGRLRSICVSPEGKVYIGVSNRDGRGTPKADDDKIVELSLPSTSTEEVANFNVKIFPNPATNNLTISNLDKSSIIDNIIIYDVLGKIILSLDNVDTNNINIATLANGFYNIKITERNSKKTWQGSFVKQN